MYDTTPFYTNVQCKIQQQMRPETTHTLYEVKDLMKEAREKLEVRMYCSAIILPDEDLDYCHNVYSAVCKVMDLL